MTLDNHRSSHAEESHWGCCWWPLVLTSSLELGPWEPQQFMSPVWRPLMVVMSSLCSDSCPASTQGPVKIRWDHVSQGALDTVTDTLKCKEVLMTCVLDMGCDFFGMTGFPSSTPTAQSWERSGGSYTSVCLSWGIMYHLFHGQVIHTKNYTSKRANFKGNEAS